MARVMSCSCYRAKTEEEFNFRPNGRPRIGPHAKTEEEGSLQKTRWAKNGGAQAEEEEGAIAKWSPNANGLKTEEEEERLPGETQRLPHARGGDPSHRGCHC